MTPNTETSTPIRKPHAFAHFHITEDDAPLIAKLSAEHQTVLNATGKYEDIALVLGLNIGTVKSRLNRARAALAKLRELRA